MLRDGGRTCVVGVVQLGHTLDLGVFDSRALLVELRLSLKLNPVHHTLHDATAVRLKNCGKNKEKKK